MRMLSTIRNISKSCFGLPEAPLSITCRGVPITREDLFAYTNGHFLVDEQNQLSRRYVRFDLDALCNTASTAGGNTSPIIAIEKMEGGFSKAFLMRKDNGTEVIAKIPCRIAGPPSLTTSGEVGVLEYVRRHTSIPVPRVLSWSSDCSNTVGAEYIIMEKAAGVPLFEQWGNMTEFGKLQLIKNLTKLEAQLSSIQYPAYGGLYLRTDIRGSTRSLDDEIDPSQSFEIGPSCDHGFHPNTTREFNRGLWDTLLSFGSSVAQRELLQISNGGQQNQFSFYKGTVEEQSQLLEITIGLMKLLDSNELLREVSRPTLWHTDLHMGNIFVAPEEPSRIVSLIDFQSTSVLPAFLQAQWPVFLRPPQNYDYVKGIFYPKLPEDFEELDEESKVVALNEWSQVKLTKAYELSTYLEDRPASNAMDVPRVFQELFIRCGEVSEVGIVPLRACLIEISRSWSELGFHGECPYTFSQQDIDEHERQFAEYQAWHDVRALAEECLDTDSDGWIPPQLDIDEKRRQNEELLAMYIERVAGERSVQEAKTMWPFS
ncbi:Aminoglycoside phosphotransferase [Penicillium cf. griseofulvum]|uniref:Altered inheritance of mitochondria protein 9, mitochondrial n=1 Tax=Penicillium cf. griseofulvum TaxID=2972120 RepID=A0A9W9N192_9EURO|nr:Aminoglycoside phosphotransferase [Penicillium cf. griseofulvum]KAJ5422597.1 Aminoglycoside phosphotransferase [Penicillium cf. griseofulvum]